ncbi:uncharacterized protein LOC109800237 isoform X2 [Cajanus cajan]|uniref:uncharacterized protein LOC109800237 isoform X2 n=1 Tax=Cajanus cajan TaxID=3821 RepID=UPI00098D7877|nr:uncharacterized protein LOC109800237 isoform X2 [Cajanus cajan]
MARRSPPRVNQTYDTKCTWRMFKIFNFREGHSERRLVSSRRHLNIQANGNGNSRSSSDVLSKFDEKNLQIGVSSRNRRDCSCKSTSSVENDEAADWRNEVLKMIVDQRFVNKHYEGKDGAICQPNQFLDALQILYSNKELFIKLLQDPNSLLVKQIHDFQSSQVKEPCQHATQKRMSRLNKPHNSNATQCVEPTKSFDRYDLSSSCKPQSSDRIVVLKPNTVNSNAQDNRPLRFPFSGIKRKLKHVMRVRRHEQQWKTGDGMPCKFSCSSQDLEDGKKVKELEIAGRNSPINDHTSAGKRLNSYLDLKKRDNIIKLKDSELCMEQEAASFCCSKTKYNTSIGPSEQNTLNIHVEGRKGPSQMLNCGIEECKQCTNSLGRSIPLPDLLSLPSLHRYCEHSSITERMRDYNNYQMVTRTRSGLPKEGENGSYSFLGPKIKDPPVTIVNINSDKLQLFGEDISLRNSVPGYNLHAHYDISRDGKFKDSPTQNIDLNNIIRGSGCGSFLDLHPEIQALLFSQDVASSSLTFSQRTKDTVVDVNHPSGESVAEQFIKDDFTNPPITIFQPDEPPVQVMQDKFKENHFEDLIRLSLNQMNNLTSSKDILDYVRKILHAFNLKCDELTQKRSCDQSLDPSTFVELKELTRQLSGGTILLDCVIETFTNVYQNYGFPPHVSTKNPNVQAYVVKKLLVKEITELVNLHFHPCPSPLRLEQLVEKDLERRGSWLNIQVDTEDIAIEVEKDVLENLVLEIASEMDIITMTYCNEPMSTCLGDDKAFWKDYLATIY